MNLLNYEAGMVTLSGGQIIILSDTERHVIMKMRSIHQDNTMINVHIHNSKIIKIRRIHRLKGEAKSAITCGNFNMPVREAYIEQYLREASRKTTEKILEFY